MVSLSRTLIALLVSAPALLAAGITRFAVAGGEGAVARAAHALFYCDQSALTPAERVRHFAVLGPALAAKRRAVHELADGYEFEFPSDRKTYEQLAEFIEAERLCCPFFDISLRAMPEHGPLSVRFTGRPGTKEFIRADAADWLKPIS